MDAFCDRAAYDREDQAAAAAKAEEAEAAAAEDVSKQKKQWKETRRREGPALLQNEAVHVAAYVIGKKSRE